MKKGLGYIGLGLLTIGVLLFLGKHSLNFFTLTFRGGDELFAWVGLLLTSVGAISWMIVFKWLAETNIQRLTALLMTVVALLGEFVTASFDIYINGLQVENFQFTPDEIRMMSYVVALLGLLAGIALAAYFVGDDVIKSFQDKDKNGIPDILEADEDVRHLGHVAMTDEQMDELEKILKSSQVGQGNNNNHKAVADPTQRQGQK